MADQNFRVKNGLEVTNGSVGIATTNPTSKLHVVGDGRFTGVVTATTFIGALTGTATTASNLSRTVTAGSGLSGGGTLTSDITLNVGSGTGITVNADDVQLKNAGSLTNNQVTKWDSGNGQLTNTIITDDGTNVGLGTTNPTSKLHVIGDGRFTGVVTATTFIGALTGTATTASNLSRTVTAGSGLSGGGTLTADVTLNVGAGSGITVNADDVQLKNAGSLTNNRVTKWDSGNGQLTNTIITDDGTNVGVGTTNPTSKLHVVGDGRFTGVVTATTFVGALTGTATTSTTVSSDSDNNTKGGTGAGSSLVASSGTNNTFFGFSAGSRVTTGDYNIALGSNALIGALSGVTGSNNVSMGRNSGNNITSANSNNFLGYFAGHNTNSGSYNNFFGYAAGYGNTTGSDNNFFGYYSGKNNTSGTNNHFFGNNVGVSNTTGYNNTFIGNQTGRFNTSGNNNIFFGYAAGSSNNTGSDNIFFGRSVAYSNTSGNHNIFFGYSTGWFNNTGSDNVFIGQQSGYKNSGSNNSFFGSFAGYDGAYGGSNNVAIGYSAQLPIASGSNQLVIASGSTAWINGNSSYNVGLGTTDPTSKLHVVGDGRFTGVVTATSFSGNASSATYATTAGIATNANFVDIQTNTTTDAIYYVPYATGTGHTSLYIDISLSYNPGQDLLTLRNVQGTKISLDEGINATGVITASSFSGNASSATNVIGGIGSITRLQVTGISTFTNGPVLIGSGTSTGTASQPIQVTGGAYVSGSVGIGTTNPTSALTVQGDGEFTGVVTATTFVGALTGTATSTTNIPNLSGDVSSVNTVTTLATVNSNVGTYGDAGAIPSITVNAKGLVTGVTTVAPNNGTLTLQVSGIGLTGSASFTANQSGNSTFTVTSDATSANTSSTIVARDASGGFSAGIITATDFNSTSDVKLKTNIRPIEDSLDKVLQIQGVSFNWIEGNKPSMGVIADEVQKILPELVSDTDPKTVNYNGLIGLLIEVVKEQNNKIELLENRISKLE